jgi:hypothetical protein
MFKTIEKLRQKPDGTKRVITFFITTALFLIILFIWFSTLGFGYSTQKRNDSVVEALSPFENLKNTLGGIFNNATEQLEAVKGKFDVEK